MEISKKLELDDLGLSSFLIAHSQKETLDALNRGDIETIQVSQKLPVDQIVKFGLKEGFLQKGLKTFPDPRASFDIPIDMMLLPQILQSLNREHSLLLAPYMLNSAELITQLGYNMSVLDQGFNHKNKYPRAAPFHGESLKHLLLKMKPEQIIKWFNQQWLPIWRNNSPGRTRQYILDGMKIKVPSHLAKDYQGCGCVKDRDGNYTHGFKAVWLQEVIDRKGVIVALSIVPIQVHDLEAARPLIADFPFEDGASLIADRGFIDGGWMTSLKRDRKIDIFIPLKRNMDATQAAIAQADHRGLWQPHPTRDSQKIAEFNAKDGGLFWKDCPELTHGVLVRWTKKDGNPEEVLFVTTKDRQSGKSILATYDQRTDIEESHRQIKMNQGIERLLSKKIVRTVFRIVMNVIGLNLVTLFLNSEDCDTFEQYSLKTLRQKRRHEKNPQVIVYTETTFGIFRLFELLPQILVLKGAIREKLAHLFKKLDLSPAFS